ncbi:MAG: hypothetical protein ACI84D_003136, partial [Thalassolituus oleivorans]
SFSELAVVASLLSGKTCAWLECAWELAMTVATMRAARKRGRTDSGG